MKFNVRASSHGSVFAIACVLLVSCGGGNATSVSPPTAPVAPSSDEGFYVADASPPQTYEIQSGALDRVPLRTDTLPLVGGRFIEQRFRRTPLSVVGPNDHEDAGIGFQGDGRYTSLYAIHEVHVGLQVPYPAGQTDTAFLYAPTTKDGCFENVTAYATTPAGTTEDLGVFDWCNNGGFVAGVTIDERFTRLYVRKIGGVPSYVTEIYAHDLHPHTGTKWCSLIYNFVTHRWNEIYELAQQPAAPDYNGWSIFEFYFVPGPCPKLPSISAWSLSLYDTHVRRWRLITPSLPQLSTSTIDGPPGSCFIDNSPLGAMYILNRLIPNYYWNVISKLS